MPLCDKAGSRPRREGGAEMESFCTTGLATTRRVGGKGVALENLGWLVAACVGGAAARAP
jgi:hypothetical protein